MKWWKRNTKNEEEWMENEPVHMGEEQQEQPENLMLDACEQMIEDAKALEDTKAEYKMVTSYLNDIQLLEDMSEEELVEIREAAENVVSLGNTRTEYLKTEKKINMSSKA